jgi:hypothetical protein
VAGATEDIVSSAWINVKFVTRDYFTATTDAGQDAATCEIQGSIASAIVSDGLDEDGEEAFEVLYDVPTYDMDAYEYNYGRESDDPMTIGEAEYWQAFEGGLVMNWSSASDNCADVNVDILNMFQGAHFGLGFGPMTDYLLDVYSDASWWEESGESYGTAFQAYNFADEEAPSGYTFQGLDWGTASLFVVDDAVCAEREIDTDGNTEEICGGLVVDSDDNLEGANVNDGIGTRRSFVIAQPYIYPGIDSFDADIIGEGYDNAWSDE